MFQLKHTVNKCSFSKMEFDKASRGAVETKMKHLRRELCQHLPSCATGSEKRIALHSRKQTGSRQAMGDKDSQDAVNRADDLTPPSRPTPLFCAAAPPSHAPRNEDIFSHWGLMTFWQCACRSETPGFSQAILQCIPSFFSASVRGVYSPSEWVR